MRTPFLDRLVGGLVWRAARVNVRSEVASTNEIATAAAAFVVGGQRLALVSLGQGEFTRNLFASATHAAGRARREHRTS